MCLLKHIIGNEAIDSSSFLAGEGPFLPRWRERPPGRRCWRRHETLCSSALLISQMSGGWEKWISSSSSQIIRVLLWFFFKRIIKREGPSNYSHVGKASHISREEKKCSGNWPGFGPQPVSLQGLEMLPHGEEGDCSPKGQASDKCWLHSHTTQLQRPREDTKASQGSLPRRPAFHSLQIWGPLC